MEIEITIDAEDITIPRLSIAHENNNMRQLAQEFGCEGSKMSNFFDDADKRELLFGKEFLCG
jgi:hypothetical protein